MDPRNVLGGGEYEFDVPVVHPPSHPNFEERMWGGTNVEL